MYVEHAFNLEDGFLEEHNILATTTRADECTQIHSRGNVFAWCGHCTSSEAARQCSRNECVLLVVVVWRIALFKNVGFCLSVLWTRDNDDAWIRAHDYARIY